MPQEREGMSVNEWFVGMRDGWQTIPVKVLSQLWLSLVPHALQIPRWVFPGISGTVFGFTFWTVCTARTGQFKAVDPQYEQALEEHKLGSVRMARPGRTTSDQQWRLNGLRVCVTRMPSIYTELRALRKLRPLSNSRCNLYGANGSARNH